MAIKEEEVHYHNKTMKAAFTLLELIVTLIIISIIAALAVPRLAKAVEAVKAKEARAALEQIRAGERLFRMQERSYYPVPAGSAGVAGIRQFLNVSLDEKNWSYTVTTTGPDNFIAEAQRKGGPNDDEIISLNEAGDWAGNWSP